VILVGNKIDEIHGDSEQLIAKKVVPLMNEHKEIETSIECSAKDMLNVSEVFYFASKAILHPTAPLYDTIEHNLKPNAQTALRRIFTICDKGKDGLLTDEELNAFQKYVFGSPLQLQELEGVKQVVRENISDGVVNNALTESGFVYLHLLFVQRGRMETIWSVLRKFGYDETVVLNSDYTEPK
jgi:mitochondrial Rho GTPase 1